MIIVQAGMKYYFLSNSYVQRGLYVSGEFGNNITFLKSTFNGVSQSSNENNFTYAAGVGYCLRKWELNYRYQVVANSKQPVNYSGIRLIYSFQFRKKSKK
jgi:hypothetical protein